MVPSFILAILASGSLLETQSWFESFLPLRLRSRRARSSAVGVCDTALLGQALQHPPVTLARALRTMLRSAALASMVEASTPMRSPFTRPASAISARTQLETPPCGLHGAGGGSVTARNRPAPVPASPTAGTPVATGNPSTATMPTLRVDTLEVAHQVHTEVARHRRRPHPGRVIGLADRLGEASKPPSISTNCRRS